MYEHTHTHTHRGSPGKYTKGCKIFMRLNKLTSREKMSFAAKKDDAEADADEDEDEGEEEDGGRKH